MISSGFGLGESAPSVGFLLSRFSFERVDSEKINAKIYDSNALAGVFKNSGKDIPIVKDSSGQIKLKEYIKNSEVKIKEFNQIFDELIAIGEQVVIWGTGSYASRLLASSHLGDLSIAAFIDSNKNVQNKTLNNIKIRPPEWLKGKNHPIIIASRVYNSEIKTVLQEEMGYKGTIISC